MLHAAVWIPGGILRQAETTSLCFPQGRINARFYVTIHQMIGEKEKAVCGAAKKQEEIPVTGLTSVTFRKLETDEIIRLAAEAELDGVEWGSDVHVPAGDTETAKKVGEKSAGAGLRVLSYGSYYRLCVQKDPGGAFAPLLKSAVALGAPNIRVWAGSKQPEDAPESYYERAAGELRVICKMAAAEGIRISTEYHRGTLTQNAESTIKLLRLTGCENFGTYWQPNPDLSPVQNRTELRRLRPYLTNIHVFKWQGGVRRLLSDGREEWLDYIRTAEADPERTSYILEFVRDDSPEAFRKDAKTLNEWIRG